MQTQFNEFMAQLSANVNQFQKNLQSMTTSVGKIGECSRSTADVRRSPTTV